MRCRPRVLSGFAQFVPGLSATPVGALLQGGSTVINLMTGALGGIAGVSATAQSSNAGATVADTRAAPVTGRTAAAEASVAATRAALPTGRTAAARTTAAPSSVRTRGPSASAPPCDFDSASACLNSCVDPAVAGGVHSDCVDACWSYRCSVSAAPDSALLADPKAMIRGLKLYSLFQTLARRTPIVHNAQVSTRTDAHQRLTGSEASFCSSIDALNKLLATRRSEQSYSATGSFVCARLISRSTAAPVPRLVRPRSSVCSASQRRRSQRAAGSRLQARASCFNSQVRRRSPPALWGQASLV